MRAVKILKYVFVGEKSIGKEREWKRKKGKRERWKERDFKMDRLSRGCYADLVIYSTGSSRAFSGVQCRRVREEW